MDAYNQKLSDIIQKISTLMDQHIELEEKYMSVLEERNALKQEVKDQKLQISELNNNLKDLKLSKQLNSSDNIDNTALKARINEFVKEIDKCIAMLNV